MTPADHNAAPLTVGPMVQPYAVGSAGTYRSGEGHLDRRAVTAPRPCSPAAAVATARSLVGAGVYRLGTGDCDTPIGGPSDCFGFAFCRCYGVRRHRPGFNRGWFDPPSADHPQGRGPSVVDDLNSNSAIEDADHHRELFVRTDRPEPGDLIAYPTIHLTGHPTPWIGHIAIVVDVSRVLEWDPAFPDWSLLGVVQCCGPNGRRGILATDASHWNGHDMTWPKLEHRTALLRVVP